MEFKKENKDVVNYKWVNPKIDEFYPLQKGKTYVYGIDIHLHPDLNQFFSARDTLTPLSVHNNSIKFKEKNNWINKDILKSVLLRHVAAREDNVTENKGKKDSTNKVSYQEVDPGFIKEMAMRLNSNKVTFGGKYELFNWQKDQNIPELIDALERHLCDVKLVSQGREAIHNPLETIQQHLAGIAVNAQFIHYATTKSKITNEAGTP